MHAAIIAYYYGESLTLRKEYPHISYLKHTHENGELQDAPKVIQGWSQTQRGLWSLCHKL